MQELYLVRKIERPITEEVTIENEDLIVDLMPEFVLVYNHVKFGQLRINYDGIDYKALYCYIGDNEDHVEAMILDNGHYLCFGNRKYDRFNSLDNTP